jgi:checkpoint serine/threonine-protein kinase
MVPSHADENAAPAPTSFGDIMSNLGLPVGRNAPVRTPAMSTASAHDFQVFEDPPTGKVAVEASFVHSTPFAVSNHKVKAKPLVTPISAVPNRLQEEEEDDALSPIMETSREDNAGSMSMLAAPGDTSIVAPAQSAAVAAAATTVVDGVAWPFSSQQKQSMLGEMNINEMSSCTIEPTGVCPTIEVGKPLVLPSLGEVIVTDKVREGTYLASREAADVTSIDSDDEAQTEKFMITQHRPACPWEFAILGRMTQRLTQAHARLRESLPAITTATIYGDGSITAIEHADDFCLADVIAMHSKLNKPMEEPLIIFYVIEMLRMLEAVHSAKVTHGRFDGASLVLRNQEEEEDWKIMFDASGGGGWSTKGLTLTGFGDSVDLSLLNGEPLVSGAGHATLRQPSWTYESDYHGLLNVVHSLLHGEPMEVTQDDESGGLKTAKPFRRFWQVNLWQSLFDELLNASLDEMPNLGRQREAFEGYLAQNPFKAKSLKNSLVKQDIKLFETRA